MNEKLNLSQNLTLRTISTDTTILTNIDSRSSMNTLSPNELVNEKQPSLVKYTKNPENETEKTNLPKNVEVEFLLEEKNPVEDFEPENILYYEGFPAMTHLADAEENETIEPSTNSCSKHYFQVRNNFY